jgi:hypothetical protein
LRELTYEEALAIASRTILSTLRDDRRALPGGRVLSDRVPEVRILGLTLDHNTAEWYDQDRLVRLIEQRIGE